MSDDYTTSVFHWSKVKEHCTRLFKCKNWDSIITRFLNYLHPQKKKKWNIRPCSFFYRNILPINHKSLNKIIQGQEAKTFSQSSSFLVTSRNQIFHRAGTKISLDDSFNTFTKKNYTNKSETERLIKKYIKNMK